MVAFKGRRGRPKDLIFDERLRVPRKMLTAFIPVRSLETPSLSNAFLLAVTRKVECLPADCEMWREFLCCWHCVVLYPDEFLSVYESFAATRVKRR